MALRNIDLDSAIRCICHCDVECFGALLEACIAKMKALGIKADPNLAVGKAPRHGGRRNPLRGQLKGSGDLNVRGLLDWVESIDALPPEVVVEDGQLPTADQAAAIEARNAMATAHAELAKVHATLVAHSK